MVVELKSVVSRLLYHSLLFACLINEKEEDACGFMYVSMSIIPKLMSCG